MRTEENITIMVRGYLYTAVELAEETSLELEDFSLETITRAVKDCTKVLNQMNDCCVETYSEASSTESLAMLEYVKDLVQIGIDFWLTRNGHGSGIWDRGLGEFGTKMATYYEEFKVLDVVIGDDGQLHLEG